MEDLLVAPEPSYVMEFFLQSLVKRKTILRQSEMLWLQRWLMMSASVGATVVLWELVIISDEAHGNRLLLPIISTASLILNFTHRHHDVFNTMAIAGMITLSKFASKALFSHYPPGDYRSWWLQQ